VEELDSKAFFGRSVVPSRYGGLNYVLAGRDDGRIASFAANVGARNHFTPLYY
jgi:hypothetical protein